MRTFHHTWLDQLTHKLKFLTFVVIIFLITTKVYSITPEITLNAISDSPPLGLVEYLEDQIKSIKIAIEKIKDEQSKNPNLIKPLKSYQSVSLHPLFLKSILMHTNSHYLKLVGANECLFYSLMDSNLLKWSFGDIKEVILTTQEIDSENKKIIQNYILSRDDFLDYIFEKKCFYVKENRKLFTDNNLKSTLNSLNIKSPENEFECLNQFSKLKEKNYLTNICGTVEETKTNEKKKTFFSPIQLIYLNLFCQNIHEGKNFCDNFLSGSIWDKSLNYSDDMEYLSYYCYKLKNKKTLTRLELSECVEEFKANPNLCHYLGSDQFKELYPLPSCITLSNALKIQKNKAKTLSCPGRTADLSAVMVDLLTDHFNEKKSTQTNEIKQKKKIELKDNLTESCASLGTQRVFELLDKNDKLEFWHYQLCYFDPIKEEQICHPFYYGENSNPESINENSETSVVAKILKKTKGVDENITCHLADDKSFNLTLLNYKTGCYLVYEKNNCNQLECPKKIYVNEKQMDHLTYKTGMDYTYIPIKVTLRHQTILYLLEKELKLNTQTIAHSTKLKSFIKEHPKGIIHGIGCLEDLMPTYFKSRSMGGCTPTPFLVSNFVERKDSTYLLVNTSVNNVYAPLFIAWPRVYNALRNFKNIHPLREWTFYGLYK